MKYITMLALLLLAGCASSAGTPVLETMTAPEVVPTRILFDDFQYHHSWLPAGRYGIENLNNLDLLPPKGATIFVGAPKHRGGTGGPARVMAVV